MMNFILEKIIYFDRTDVDLQCLSIPFMMSEI